MGRWRILMIKEVVLGNGNRARKSSRRSMPALSIEAAEWAAEDRALSSPVTRIPLLAQVWEERHQDGEAEQCPRREGRQAALSGGRLPDRPSHHPPGGESPAAAGSGKGRGPFSTSPSSRLRK